MGVTIVLRYWIAVSLMSPENMIDSVAPSKMLPLPVFAVVVAEWYASTAESSRMQVSRGVPERELQVARCAVVQLEDVVRIEFIGTSSMRCQEVASMAVASSLRKFPGVLCVPTPFGTSRTILPSPTG